MRWCCTCAAQGVFALRACRIHACVALRCVAPAQQLSPRGSLVGEEGQ